MTEVGGEMLAIVVRLVEPAEPQAQAARRVLLVSTEIRTLALHRRLQKGRFHRDRELLEKSL